MDHDDEEVERLFTELAQDLQGIKASTERDIAYITGILEFLEQGLYAQMAVQFSQEMQDQLDALRREDAVDSREIILSDSVFFRYRASTVIHWYAVLFELPRRSQKILNSAIISALLSTPWRMFYAWAAALGGENAEQLIDSPDIIIQNFIEASPYAKMRSDVDRKFWELVIMAVGDLDADDDKLAAGVEYAELVALSDNPSDLLISMGDILHVLCDILMSTCHSFTDYSFEEYVSSYISEYRSLLVDSLIEASHKEPNSDDQKET